MNDYVRTDLEQIGITACFTGHRFIADKDRDIVFSLTEKAIEEFYAKGYRRFFCGAAIGFDMLAAEAVLHMKTIYDDLRLILAIPCSEQYAKWADRDVKKWKLLCEKADRVDVLSEFYYDGCMEVRNRYMVDRSSLCICWLKSVKKGGTLQTVHLASENGLSIHNLAMEVHH